MSLLLPPRCQLSCVVGLGSLRVQAGTSPELTTWHFCSNSSLVEDPLIVHPAGSHGFGLLARSSRAATHPPKHPAQPSFATFLFLAGGPTSYPKHAHAKHWEPSLVSLLSAAWSSHSIAPRGEFQSDPEVEPLAGTKDTAVTKQSAVADWRLQNAESKTPALAASSASCFCLYVMAGSGALPPAMIKIDACKKLCCKQACK